MQSASWLSSAALVTLPPSLVESNGLDPASRDFPKVLSKRLYDLALELATQREHEQEQLLVARIREVDLLAAQNAELRKWQGMPRTDKFQYLNGTKRQENGVPQVPDESSVCKNNSGQSQCQNQVTVPTARRSVVFDCLTEERAYDVTSDVGQSHELGTASTTSLKDMIAKKSFLSCSSATTEVTIIPDYSEPLTEQTNDFEVLAVWKKLAERGSSNGGTRSVCSSSKGSLFNTDFHSCPSLLLSGIGVDDKQEHHLRPKQLKFLDKWILMEPCSLRRTVWDLLAMALVFFDIIRIPLELLNPPQSPFTTFMAWLVRLYWTFDMPLNFITGYIRNDGTTEQSLKTIARRYVCTWFVPDLLLVLTDWLEVIVTEIVSSEIDLARVGKTARLNRIFRALRLVRLVRIFRISESFRQLARSFVSEHLVVVFDICMLVLLVVGLAHIIGCLWHGLGNWESRHGEARWIYSAGMMSETLEHQYFVSLHWALAQFSGGMDEFRPTNVDERVFAICSLLLGFIVLSICVSGLTSAMTRLLLISSGPSRQLSKLRQYLYEHHISSELTMRILRNSRFIIKQQQRCMSENDIELIGQISEPLRMELHYETRAPQLASHYFFNRYKQVCPYGMRSICHYACSEKSVSAGDLIFSLGECPRRASMLFVRNGRLRYVQESGNNATIDAGQWISEAVLWTTWSHYGTLNATTECDLLVLDSSSFQDIVSRFAVMTFFDPAEYASEFVRKLNRSSSDEISDLELEYQRGGQRVAFRSSYGKNQLMKLELHGRSQGGKKMKNDCNDERSQSCEQDLEPVEMEDQDGEPNCWENKAPKSSLSYSNVLPRI